MDRAFSVIVALVVLVLAACGSAPAAANRRWRAWVVDHRAAQARERLDTFEVSQLRCRCNKRLHDAFVANKELTQTTSLVSRNTNEHVRDQQGRREVALVSLSVQEATQTARGGARG
jgi:hypothetical protein